MTATRIALVTGAGTGIGRAACIALSEVGWTIVATGRRLEPLNETLAMASAQDTDHLAVTADVADPDSVTALFDRIESTFGRLDLLFNNAGAASPPVAFDEITLEDWQRVVAVNLTGSFLCARAAFSLMKRQSPSGGRIINNGSVSAHTPRPNSAPYTATKHAVTGLTKSLALDGRLLGITCGQIDIGNALTEMTEPMTAGVAQADGSMKAEPTMRAEDVGRAITYMAGLPPDANVLTMTVMANGMPYVGRG